MELLKVLKRNGDIVDFDRFKIEKAIVGAMEDLAPEHINEGLAKRIARDIERELEEGVLFDGRNPSKTLPNPSGDNTSKTLTPIPIHVIEDRVEEKLMGSHCKDVARQYIVYRASKAKIRLEKQALDLLNDSNEELKTENSNKNTILNSTQRDYMAGILCKDISRNYFSKDLLRAHDKGMIHIHDLDFSPALPMFNCCLVNLDDMLENGTRLSDMDIVKPKSFMTACAVTAQIIFAVSGNQYGGQTISLSHLAPFVKISKEKYERKYRELGFSGENLEKLTEFSLKKEIKDGIQCLVYNVITMSNSNGQAPFLSIFLWLNEKPDYVKETAMLIEEMIQQRLDGFKDKNGRAVTIAFPKLLYVLDDNNTYPDSPYYYLTELAARCTAKRMVPDYISAKKMREYKEGNVFPCMGCRSFLQPYYDENNQPKFYGRFNQGVVTLNLPYVAMQSKGNKEEFWRLLEEATQKCYEALMIRHNRLKKVKSDVSPIHWQYGALARLNPGENIEELLYNDYSSISLGYAGLYECTKYMTGYSHTDEHGHDFAIQVLENLDKKC